MIPRIFSYPSTNHLVVFHTKPQIDGLPVKTQISNNLKPVNFQAFFLKFLLGK